MRTWEELPIDEKIANIRGILCDAEYYQDEEDIAHYSKVLAQLEAQKGEW